MENAIHSTRAILYFLFDKGIDFNSDPINSVFDSVSSAWEHFWALEDTEAQTKANEAFLKVLEILGENNWLAEYFLTNSK